MKIDINWLISSYGFVVDRGVFTFDQWAAKIKESYSLDNKVNFVAYSFLSSTTGTIERKHDYTYTIKM